MTETSFQKIKYTAIIFFIMICFFAAGCQAKNDTSFTSSLPSTGESGYGLSAAVLYDAADNDGSWKNTLGYLEQSTLVDLTATAVDVNGSFDLTPYQIVYLDHSIAQAQNGVEVEAAVEAYTTAGGTVVLDNALYGTFDPAFIGASGFVKVTECPLDLTCPDLGDDIGELQGILSDFAKVYGSYADYETLAGDDYGYAVQCDTAVSIADWAGYGLYTVNRYGDGMVFFTNPLLPNAYSVSGFDMQPLNDEQMSFASTTASCNQLLVNAFAGYAAKQIYGYYLGRVFGSFGSPDMAWELHYEEITGIANNSMEKFSELCKEYRQIPSFVLIRNSYTWFLRTETVTYYLNEANDGELKYNLNFNEDAYSSGTHIASGDEWLHLGEIEDGGSYFLDFPEYTYRAYPYLCDYNGDNIADVFCGSYDGKIYYYQGTSFEDRLSVADAHTVTDGNGKDLSLDGYSAPQLLDVNGDGKKDIVSGAADGDIYWFRGDGSLHFEPEGVLLKTDLKGQSMPAVGDLNGDGVSDLALGSNESILLIFYGEKQKDGSLTFSYKNAESLSRSCANAQLGTWLAPEIYDLDNDGNNELVLGTFDGYVAVFDSKNGGQLSFDDFLETGEMNYKGNYHIKTGNNCVPVFYDLNGDGNVDLVCGSLEYGLAYPIDSPYFPYREELQEQVNYAKANDIYVGVHFYTNSYASKEREAAELTAHIAALNDYGLDTDRIGTNQHTWYTSTFNQAQSLLSAWDAGLLWNSGFAPAGSTFKSPQAAAENVISLPFFLVRDGEETILVQNCSVLPYCDTNWTDLSGKYAMPVCVYYHCDFIYESDEEARLYMQQLSDFWWRFGYNFAEEDQMMAATAAAYHLDANVSGSGFSVDQPIDITITPKADETDYALWDEDYQNASGLKIAFSENVDTSQLGIDADVWRLDGHTLYLGLNRSVSVVSGGAAAEHHIERVNIAAKIEATGSGATVTFLDDGMMQVVVAGKAHTKNAGWDVMEKDGHTVFTKYGSADVLQLKYDS